MFSLVRPWFKVKPSIGAIKFWIQKIFRHKIFFNTPFFRPGIVMDQKKFCTQHFLDQIFFRTNVACINVSGTNVPETVAMF